MWNKKEMSQLDVKRTRVPLTLTFDLEFSRSNCISGMGGPIVMEWKEWESIGCPDVKHYENESTGCCADWVPLTLNFQGQIVSPEWEALLSWNERDRMPWCKTQPQCDPEAEDIFTEGVT